MDPLKVPLGFVEDKELQGVCVQLFSLHPDQGKRTADIWQQSLELWVLKVQMTIPSITTASHKSRGD
jgi:hypothetical protein